MLFDFALVALVLGNNDMTTTEVARFSELQLCLSKAENMQYLVNSGYKLDYHKYILKSLDAFNAALSELQTKDAELVTDLGLKSLSVVPPVSEQFRIQNALQEAKENDNRRLIETGKSNWVIISDLVDYFNLAVRYHRQELSQQKIDFERYKAFLPSGSTVEYYCLPVPEEKK